MVEPEEFLSFPHSSARSGRIDKFFVCRTNYVLIMQMGLKFFVVVEHHKLSNRIDNDAISCLLFRTGPPLNLTLRL
jgi:hypothetical protein